MRNAIIAYDLGRVVVLSRRIGLDVGGVIIDAAANDGTDTDIRSDNFMCAKSVKGAYEGVQQLVMRYGSSNVVIISRCGEVIEARTRQWLAGNGFYTRTGFDPANLYFCLTREAKAPIAETLGLTDFVDDHQDVLDLMGSVAGHYLFGPQPKAVQSIGKLFVVKNWPETVESITQRVS